MFGWLKRLFTKPDTLPEESLSWHAGEDLTDYEMAVLCRDGHCPDCGGTLYEGPEGGGSQNVVCGKCYSEFNLALPLFVHRISDRGPRELGDRASVYRMPPTTEKLWSGWDVAARLAVLAKGGFHPRLAARHAEKNWSDLDRGTKQVIGWTVG